MRLIQERFLQLDRKDHCMAARVDVEKCTGCAQCVEACPVEAITLEDEKAVIDQDNCLDCAACVAECPTEAISMPE